jgi:acyl phosphate:glycerol-3-phosphate acyltransferase
MTAALAVVGYLSGSVPYGLLLTRMFRGVDVRTSGSGNIGATNVARVAGPRLGALVLILDALKGALPVLLARAVSADAVAPALVGLAAFAGHVAPPWLGFRGGKGVATALGVLAVLAPRPALAAVATFGLLFALFRVSSVGSIGGGLAAVLVAWCVEGTSRPAAWLTTGLFLLILWTHRGNLGRLLRRSEPRI